MQKEQNNEAFVRELAECIYDLDAEVYSQIGSSLGRVFNRDRERCVRELTELLTTRPQGHLVRSELALIANMARTIPDRAEKKLVMTEYNRILTEVMKLPGNFVSGDVIDPELAKLNVLNLQNRFSENDHLIICISWGYASGGVDVGFKLADKLKINYYDEEIFQAVLKRLEAEKGTVQDSVHYTGDLGLNSPTSVFESASNLTLRQHFREFSRYHGLSKRDAVFFNQSDLLCDMAKKEDFIIMGRCGNAIMTNNQIPHISIYNTAPFEQRVRHACEINNIQAGKASRLIKRLDRKHARYYNFYTSRKWGHANNYDLCINTASYGIDGTVDFILRMIDRGHIGIRGVKAQDVKA